MANHEDRFVQIMTTVLPDFLVAQELTIPRKARHLDLVANIGTPPILLGALQEDCADRCVLFEHESEGLRAHKAGAAMMGHAWLMWQHMAPSSGKSTAWMATTPRPPIAVILAESVSPEVCDRIPNLQARPEPGLWATRDLGRGGIALISVRDLAPHTNMDLWAWLGRADNAEVARRRLERLLDNANIPTLEKHRITEAVVEGRIITSEEERESTYQRLLREGREVGREEGREVGRQEGEALAHLKILSALDPERARHLRDCGASSEEIFAAILEAVDARRA